MRLSVTARIALLSIVLALVSNLVVVGFVWKQTHDTAIGAVRRETIEKSDAMRAIWRSGGLAAVAGAIDDARAPGDTSLLLAVLDASGARTMGYAPARLSAPLVETSFRIGDLDGPGGAHDVGYALQPMGRGWLLVGRSLDLVEAEQRTVERALALGVLLSLLLGIGGGLLLARYVGRRLDRIAAVIVAAGEGDLSRRVEALSGGDAFDRLAVRLNLMLAKLERLWVELRVVTDSLAHDLRSPLARLRTKTEQAVLIADPVQREAALGGLLVETDLVMRMLTTVIEISRAEAISRDRFILVAPAALVEEIGELYEPVAEEAGLVFVTAIDDRPEPIPIHRELLSQAITNLVDNALKHGAGGGTLTLRIIRLIGAEIAIQVEDRGAGIAAADHGEARRRFGRLDAARTTPGAGLGMALIDAVARLHGGRFELADNAPGLIARIVLPA